MILIRYQHVPRRPVAAFVQMQQYAAISNLDAARLN
jgi:hypothetical protein